MHRFYAHPESFANGEVTLDPDATHHLRDVLRMAAGDEVRVFDGEGREFACRVESPARSGAVLAVLGETEPSAPESPLALTVAATVIPGDNYDLIIQKAVELGVYEVVPLHSVRCEVKLKDAARRLTRWRRIALGATAQCGRARLMQVREPVEYADLIHAADPKTTLMFSEREGAALETGVGHSSLTVIFGPKGGWDDAELELARGRGLPIVTLGGRILRAETAAIAITAILQHRYGDLR